MCIRDRLRFGLRRPDKRFRTLRPSNSKSFYVKHRKDNIKAGAMRVSDLRSGIYSVYACLLYTSRREERIADAINYENKLAANRRH